MMAPAASAAAERASPPSFMALSQLNKSTCNFGSWVVKCAHAQICEYSYKWGGKDVTNKKLAVTLVSPDPGRYSLGVMKAFKRDFAELEAALDSKWIAGTVWRMTKVVFTDEKAAYIHAPYKLAIDMRKTKFAALLVEPLPLASVPEPPAEVKELVAIKNLSTQAFDVTGLLSMSEVRRHITPRGLRAITDVTLIDGSLGDSGKVAEIRFTLYFPCASTTSDLPKALTDLQALCFSPVSFFGLQASNTSDGYRVSAREGETFWMPAEGSKAAILRERASDLQSQSTQTLTKDAAWEPRVARDFLADAAQPMTVALLNAYVGQNATVVHDKVFQLNYVQVEAPASGNTVLTENGDRVWLSSVRVLDFSGSIELSVREKGAFQLAGLHCNTETREQSKDAFVTCHANGSLQFPVLSSIRVHFHVKKQTEPKLGETQLQIIVVEAEEQDLEQVPNMSSLNLVNLISECRPRTDGLVAAQLSEIQGSSHYAMEVHYDGNIRAADKALALVISVRQAQQEDMGDKVYRLITPGVLDALAVIDSGLHAEELPQHMLIGMCVQSKLKDVLLDPPRSGKKRQAALVIITAVTGKREFMMEMVRLITEDELPAMATTMRKLQHLSARTKFNSSGAQPDWSTPDSGLMRLQQRKCRRLSLSPTDDGIPDLPRAAASPGRGMA